MKLQSFQLEFIIGIGRSSNNASVCCLVGLSKTNVQQLWPFDSFVSFEQLRGEISASLAEKITKEMKRSRRTALCSLAPDNSGSGADNGGRTNSASHEAASVDLSTMKGCFCFEFFIATKSNVPFPLAKNNNPHTSQIKSH